MAGETTLILGNQQDEHARHMLAYLKNRGCDVELVDSRWFPSRMSLAFDPQSRLGQLALPGGRSLSFADVRSVYWRTYDRVQIPPLPDPEQSWIAENDSRGLWESLLLELPARWVNGWDGFQLHQTKPAALARVAALGVRVPETIVTNDAGAVKEFLAQRGRCIVKPVQGGDHATRITAAEIRDDQLVNLELAPITLQEEVPGTNIRVFVAGQRVCACEIRTAAVDFRDDPQAHLVVHDLPAAIQAQSQQICHTLKLAWSGIDFRLTPSGEYVFLEANPSPMFLGFERATGLPLSENLAALLLQGSDNLKGIDATAGSPSSGNSSDARA